MMKQKAITILLSILLFVMLAGTYILCIDSSEDLEIALADAPWETRLSIYNKLLEDTVPENTLERGLTKYY